MGALAPIGIFVLRSTSILFPALPSTAYSILAGGLLGFKKGLLVICSADLTSCAASFFISKYFGRKLLKGFLNHKTMSKIEEISKKHLENNFFLMTGFLMTGLFDFVSYGIGLTKTPWRKYFPALIISIALSNPPIVAVGAGILEGGKVVLVIASLACLAIALISQKVNFLSNKNT